MWKPLSSICVLNTSRGSPKRKAQRGQYLLAVGLGRYIFSLLTMLSAYTHFHGNILPLGLRNEICSCHYNTFFFLVESLHLKVISSAHAGRLFISDTNNNVIRYLDLNNQEQPQLLTLELKGVQPPNPKPKSFKRLRKRSSDTQTIVVDGGSFREGNLSLKISLPEEYHFSKVHFTLS